MQFVICNLKSFGSAVLGLHVLNICFSYFGLVYFTFSIFSIFLIICQHETNFLKFYYTFSHFLILSQLFLLQSNSVLMNSSIPGITELVITEFYYTFITFRTLSQLKAHYAALYGLLPHITLLFTVKDNMVVWVL